MFVHICSLAAFSSAVRASPRPALMPARKAALSNFHFGTLPSLAGGGVFLVWFILAAGGGGGGGCLKSYTYGARCAAALKAFLLDWKTFSQTF